MMPSAMLVGLKLIVSNFLFSASSRTCSRHAIEPLRNASVRSLPSRSMMQSTSSRSGESRSGAGPSASAPAMPDGLALAAIAFQSSGIQTCSAGCLGTGRPPAVSGHTTTWSCAAAKSFTHWQSLLPPLYLQGIPSKHPLMIYMEACLPLVDQRIHIVIISANPMTFNGIIRLRRTAQVDSFTNK